MGLFGMHKKTSISITFFWSGSFEMITVSILIAMKYIVNGVLQKHMVFFLFYQNLVGQVVGNKALMGIA